MSLVEMLARRMSHVTYANPSYPNAVYDQDWELFTDAARECIRQMEWTRDQCSEQVGGAAEDTDERIWDMKLTLAPDGWKP